MDKETRKMIKELTKSIIEGSASLDVGSEEQSMAITELETLCNLEGQSKDRVIKAVLETAGIVLPVAVSTIFVVWLSQLEEKGAVTSSLYRWLSQRIRLTK